MDSWDIQRLGPAHDRRAFDCGIAALNDWLQKLAGQYERRDLARTYVATNPGESTVLGYYAISSHRVTYEALAVDQAKGLPRIDVPVILLGRLAVDRTTSGQGLGEFLLLDALRRANHIADQVGVRAVEVDALNDRAKSFYHKYGFVTLSDNEHHLFLPIDAIRKLNLPPI